MGNWFGKGKRGMIFGIWNSHTSLGNILGSLVAAEYVETDWALSFMVPGVIIGIIGFLVFLFLVVYPRDVGCIPPKNEQAPLARRMENKVAYDSVSVHSDDEVDARIGERVSFEHVQDTKL